MQGSAFLKIAWTGEVYEQKFGLTKRAVREAPPPHGHMPTGRKIEESQGNENIYP